MTRGTISGFDILTMGDTSSSTATPAVVSATDALSAVAALLNTTEIIPSAEVIALIKHHIAEASPHQTSVTADDADALTAAFGSFFDGVDASMTIVDPVLDPHIKTNSIIRLMGDVSYGLRYTSHAVQTVNGRIYVQMFGTPYAPIFISLPGSPTTVRLGDEQLTAYQLQNVQHGGTLTESGDFTLAGYLIGTVSVSLGGITVHKTGDVVTTTGAVHTRALGDDVVAFYMFADADISMDYTVSGTGVLCGFRHYASHAVLDGHNPVLVDSPAVIALPTGERPFVVALEYLPGRAINGGWINIGASVSVEYLSPSEKRVTITNGDIVSQMIFAVDATTHDICAVTYAETNVSYEDAYGNTLQLGVAIDLPDSVTIGQNDGYLGRLIHLSGQDASAAIDILKG